MDLIKQLNWRYATKRMNGKAVPQKKIDIILEAIQLAPSSFGLTPYTVLVITDMEVRKKIQTAAYMQAQIVEGSHLLVFAAWSDISEKQVDEFIALTAKTRGMPVSALADYKNYIMSSVTPRSPKERSEWGARQAYIALGFGLTAAALEEVDACPMEGFDSAKVDEILGLAAKGLKSTVFMALGYRDEKNDKYATLKKVRRDKKELFVRV